MNTQEKNIAAKRIRSSRERTHLLKKSEFATIEWLCQRMPSWVSPDLLTFTGMIGSAMIALGLVLAVGNRYFLIISIVGFAVQWFGDSLDGRLAYYRNTPRKWYGWSLDINADWISVCLIGFGFYYYFPTYKFMAFVFIVVYGGAMIINLMRYKIADKYTIDTNGLSSTELRIVTCLVMIAEMYWSGSLFGFSILASVLLVVFNFFDAIKVLKLGDHRDIQERMAQSQS